MIRSAIATLLVLALLAAPLPAAAVQVGETAPDFLAEDVQGGPPISISGHRNQVVLLVFFWTS